MYSSLHTRIKLLLSLAVLWATHCYGKQAPHPSAHECYRTCSWPPEPMVCNYHFSVEWFSTMSVFCGDCPYNVTDCDADNCIPLNGVQRPIITVNRLMPGPSIQVCEGDVINVTVANHLDDHEELTIHWHGLHQVGTPYMDGVPKVTQCPIPYGSSFVYTFNASNTGTHYWHAHTGFQRADGCLGNLIVRQASKRNPHYDSYDVDDPAHILLLQDIFDSMALSRYLGHYLVKLSNAPDGLLINGHGQRAQFPSGDGEAPVYTAREVLHVQPGKTHRFRMISNIVTHCPLQVSVDNHTLSVIAADGFDVMAEEVDIITVFAAERYDFLLTANQEAGNYWLRLQGLGDCSTAHEVALINYIGTDVEATPSLPDEYISVQGVELNPYNAMDLSSPLKMPIYSLRSLVPDTDEVLTSEVNTYYLTMDVNNVTKYSLDNYFTPDPMRMRSHDAEMITGDARGRGLRLTSTQLNHASFLIPNANLLTQYDDIDPSVFCDATNIDPGCVTSYCECAQVLTVELGENVELVIVDEGFQFDQSHPLHMHGYGFRVVAQARLGTSLAVEDVKEMDRRGQIVRNLVDPPVKDTVSVPDGGYTIVRFKANNPGWWAMHCHLQLHNSIGMMLLIHVGDDSDLPPVPDNFPTCNDWPASTGSVEEGTGTGGDGKGHVVAGSIMLLIASWIAVMVNSAVW